MFVTVDPGLNKSVRLAFIYVETLLQFHSLDSDVKGIYYSYVLLPPLDSLFIKKEKKKSLLMERS